MGTSGLAAARGAGSSKWYDMQGGFATCAAQQLPCSSSVPHTAPYTPTPPTIPTPPHPTTTAPCGAERGRP